MNRPDPAQMLVGLLLELGDTSFRSIHVAFHAAPYLVVSIILRYLPKNLHVQNS